MYEIELTGGIALKMPENLSEITVEQYCEFLQGVEDFVKWQNERLAEEDGDMLSSSYQLERLHRMSRMIEDFCTGGGADSKTLSAVFQMPLGDYMESLKQSFSINDMSDIDLDKSEATLYNLWANICKVITTADVNTKGDELKFEWKGGNYELKPVNRDRMTGRELPPDMSVQQAVEVLELRRKAGALIEKNHEWKNVKWELLHRQLAILALKEGEELPVDDLEFERFVSERAADFVGIDAETALRVDFFLAGALGLLKSTLTAITSSILLDPKASQTRNQGGRSRRRTKPLASASATSGSISD